MPETLIFDHALIAVTDLEAARTDFETLGFTVFYGGKHADGRTENCLIILQDGGYLELIALTDPEVVLEPGGMHAGLFGPGEGWAGYALLSTDVRRDTEAMRERGLDLVGPLENSRERPDGERVAWAAAVMTDSEVPFFIEDVTPRGLRVPSEHGHHPNGVTGVSRVIVAVSDLESATARYEKIFGEGPSPVSSPVAGARVVDFKRGMTVITLADGSTPSISDHLARRGDSPYAVTLTTGGDVGELDITLTHGAPISLETASR